MACWIGPIVDTRVHVSRQPLLRNLHERRVGEQSRLHSALTDTHGASPFAPVDDVHQSPRHSPLSFSVQCTGGRLLIAIAGENVVELFDDCARRNVRESRYWSGGAARCSRA